jgi:2-amino-4-hydroxy-6-hydroxymethyldihydropteridine diphosphokinase
MILIAIGANLPAGDGTSPIETCRRAVTEIAGIARLQLTAASGWWLSAPVPPSGQPPYINGIARFDGHIDPENLLKQLQSIESRFGRCRSEVNAARTLDLDIIAMDAMVRDAPDPILPHPRAHLRAFVLAPLHEIAPNWLHPRLNRTAQSLLKETANQACERIPSEFGIRPPI